MKKFCFIAMLLIAPLVNAAEVSVSRYTIAETHASNGQRFPLVDVRSIDIPDSVVTNRQAVDFILLQTGYLQASNSVRSTADKLLMRKALANSNRSLVNLSLLEMLNVIAGIGYVPVIDPINRLVAFEATYDFKH